MFRSFQQFTVIAPHTFLPIINFEKYRHLFIRTVNNRLCSERFSNVIADNINFFRSIEKRRRSLRTTFMLHRKVNNYPRFILTVFTLDII